jgi:hypothetical protein
MFFPVLRELQESNPQLNNTIAAMDSFLARLEGNTRLHITASGVAQAIGAPRDEVLGVLMAAANLGLLRLKFRVICPTTNGGVRDYDSLADIPRSIACDLCGQEHVITPDDVEYFFELQDQLVGAHR